MIIKPKTLKGRHVRLEPITPELREEMRGAVDCDPAAWEIMSINGCGEGFAEWWAMATRQSDSGERVVFAIRRLSDKRVVGTSSYLGVDRLNRGLEVGATFLRPDVRSGPVNPESKLLMLANAFDAGAIRVQFTVDMRNARSQAAVLKLGASQEGVLRNHKITWTGHVRDSAIFSITDYDWPGVKQRLEFRLQEDFVS
jgi:RimJ/RimL family protein N-acetyltransferase